MYPGAFAETSRIIIITNQLIGFYVTQKNVKIRKTNEFLKKDCK